MKIFNTKTLIALGLTAFTAIDSVASISMKPSNDDKTKDVSAFSKQETSGSSSTSISPNTQDTGINNDLKPAETGKKQKKGLKCDKIPCQDHLKCEKINTADKFPVCLAK